MKRRTQALEILAGERASGTGLLNQSTRALTVGLGCRWAGIGRIQEDGKGVDMLAFWDSEGPAELFSYELDDSPCDKIYSLSPDDPYRFYPDSVTSLFTGPPLLSQIGANSYRGEALYNSAGAAVAHIFAIDTEPMPKDIEDEEFFRLVSQRVGAEYRRLLSEDALAESNGRYQSLLEHVADALIIHDLDGGIKEVNRRACLNTGYSSTELVSMSVADIEVSVDLEKIIAVWRNTELGEVQVFEGVHRRKDGTTFPVEVRGEIVQTAGYRQVLVSARDITENKKIQNRLNKALNLAQESAAIAKASDDRLRDAIDAMSEGFALFDADERLVMCNEPYRQSLPRSAKNGLLTPGTKLEDIIKHNINLGFVPSIYENGEEYLEKRLAAFRNPSGPIEFRTTNGHWIRFEERKTSDGGTVGIRTDITERKKTEEQLRQSQKMEAVGQLTGGVAHDFNNLLGVIVGNLDFLQEMIGNDPERQEMIEIALQAALQGAELTSRLLAFSRKQSLRPVTVDLNVQLNGMINLLRRTLGEIIDIHTVESTNLKLVKIDPGQFEAALLNLAVNARQAMPDGGSMTIEIGNAQFDQEYAGKHAGMEPGKYAMLAVSDTGIGMSQNVIEQAFDPFFTTKSVGEGSGLGLSMVHGFVIQSGGHISIYSEEGEGTTVKLYFPIIEAAASPADESLKSADLPRGAGESVLIVEDDDSLRNLAVKIVSALGYKVEAVPDGPSALKLLDTGVEIDILFTDVVLPRGMNGVALAAAAMERRPKLSVLYTSGYTENAIVHNGVIDEGINLLDKPYRRQEVAQRLREIVERKG